MYPTITFQVNLAVPREEKIGPITNSDNSAILHPDRHDNDQDRAITNISNHSSEKITWLAGLLGGSNINLKHGDTFTLSGQKAEYVRKMFVAPSADGTASSTSGEAPSDRAILTITNVA